MSIGEGRVDGAWLCHSTFFSPPSTAWTCAAWRGPASPVAAARPPQQQEAVSAPTSAPARDSSTAVSANTQVSSTPVAGPTHTRHAPPLPPPARPSSPPPPPCPTTPPPRCPRARNCGSPARIPQPLPPGTKHQRHKHVSLTGKHVHSARTKQNTYTIVRRTSGQMRECSHPAPAPAGPRPSGTAGNQPTPRGPSRPSAPGRGPPAQGAERKTNSVIVGCMHRAEGMAKGLGRGAHAAVDDGAGLRLGHRRVRAVWVRAAGARHDPARLRHRNGRGGITTAPDYHTRPRMPLTS